jgi:hypothetical protein
MEYSQGDSLLVLLLLRRKVAADLAAVIVFAGFPATAFAVCSPDATDQWTRGEMETDAKLYICMEP